MSDRQLVLNLVARLPENMPIEEILREIELLKAEREQASQKERMTAEDARRLAAQWGCL